MDKLKLRPIDLPNQTKRKESRPTTPSNYPSDMKFKFLPGICKSNALQKLAEDVSTLTRMIKTEKPLTLKPNRKNPLKMEETVEQYLSSINIGLLDVPSLGTICLEDILSLLGAKDEKEAIGVMYKALSMLEMYFNRVIQHIMITIYNTTKDNSNKPIKEYFASEFSVVNELVKEYQQMGMKQRKSDVNISDSNKTIKNENDNFKAKYEKLLKKYDLIKKKQRETIRENEDNNSTEFSKLKAEIDNLTSQLNKEKEAHKKTLQIKELESKPEIDDTEIIL